MNKAIVLILFLVISSYSQITRPAPTYFGKRAVAPATCTPNNPSWYFDSVSNTFKYCSASNTWSGLGGLSTGSTVSGATAGSVFFAGTSGVLDQDNTGLFYDNTDNILKVGVSGSNFVRIGRMNSPSDNYTGIAFGNLSLGTGTAQIWGSATQTVLSGANEVSVRLNGSTEYGRFDATSFTTYAVSASRVPATIQLAAAQSADAFQVKNSGGSTLFKIDSGGLIEMPSGYVSTVSASAVRFSTDAGIFGYAGSLFVRGSGNRAIALDHGNKAIGVDSDYGFNWSSGSIGAAGYDTGLVRFSGGVVKLTNGASGIRGLIGGGASVASATALPLPTGRVFHVTGTTAITSITSTDFQSGVCVTLIFDDALTFTDGSNLKLAGNFVTTADDTISLCYDGTNWFETGRSVN